MLLATPPLLVCPAVTAVVAASPCPVVDPLRAEATLVPDGWLVKLPAMLDGMLIPVVSLANGKLETDVPATTPPGNVVAAGGIPVLPGRGTGATMTLDEKLVTPPGPVDVTATMLAMLAISVIIPLGPDSRTAGKVEGGEPGLDVMTLVRLRAVFPKAAAVSPGVSV